MDEARSVVSRTLNQFGEGHSGEVEGLQTAKDALFADPSLVQEFGGQLEQQASSWGPAACTWLAEIYSNAAVHSPSTELLTSGLRAAERLLARPETADAGLALGSNLIHALFQDPKLCFSGEKLWEAFHGTAESVSKLFDGTPTHSRVRAVKLMHDILLLLTSPASLKGSALGKPASKVAGQVQRYLKQLLALLRMAKSGGQNSVLTLAAIQAAQQTVLKRPGQAGRILPSLLALATASFSEVQKAGIQKCLRGGLLAVWGVDAPALKAWKPKVATALGSLGVRVEGSPPNDKRALNQAVRPEDPRMVANKSREQSPGSEAALQISSGARQQHPQQPAAQQQGVADPRLDAPLLHASQGALPAPAPSFPAGVPGDKTSDWDIQQVIAIVAALLAENDQATCLAFVNGLPPPVLADVVLVSMAHLPRREEVFKSEPHAAGPESQKSGNTLLAGLMQATAQPEGAPPLPQPNPAVFHQVMQQTAARQPSEPAAAPGVTQQQALPKENKAASATAHPPTTTGPPPFATPPEKQEVSAASSRRLPAAKAASPAAIKLQPLQLTRQQLAEGRRAALRRILHASARPCQQLRSNILAHFAPNLQDDSWVEAMAAEMVDRKEAGGYELALKWLCAIFAATSEPPPAAAAEPSGVADDERRESGQAVCSRQQHVETSPAYNRCLQSLLHVCRDRLPAKDRTLIQLLVDAPALPDAVLQELLVSLLSRGDDYATLALIGARDVVLLRPRHRQQGLNAMLQMAVSPDTDVRAKAVRLIANKLFPNILLTAEIQRFAAAQLQKLCQQPQQNGKRRREEAAAPEEEVPKRQRQMAEEQPGGNGSQAEVIDGVHGDGPKLNGVPKAGVEGGERQAETASPGRGAEKRKASEQSPEHRSAERQNAAAPSDTASPEDSAEPAEPEESPEVAARHCELFCALCTKRHALLRELFVMFGRARPPGRAAVLRNAEGLARVLGLSAPALLALIEDVPAGSEALLLKMLYFLTEEQPPSQVLAEACFRNFERTRDPSFLPPALPGMPKERIIPFLPKLLDPVSLFSVALARIFLPLPSGEASMTPTELLLALHSIDPSQEGIRLKQVMGALDLCLTLRDTFNKAVLASTLQQLNQRSVLPPLYMRFLMQSQAAVPELKSFTIEQLAALVNRQIWTNKTLFTGWNLAVRQNVPESFPAFLQLPSRVLSETLQAAPPDFQQKLKEYAESPACPANQQKPIYRLLESIRKTE